MYGATGGISADGRYVIFSSTVPDLVAGDTNGVRDVFLTDRQNLTTVRVSVASNGDQANQASDSAVLSADGRYIVFASRSTNLVNGVATNPGHLFIHDRQNSTTELVTVDSTGAAGNGLSKNAAISVDGRYVAFSSIADNLVAGDTNDAYDIFVRDRQAGTTERVSVNSNGDQATGSSIRMSISADGRYVAFVSDASNLATGVTGTFRNIFVRDRQAGVTELVSRALSGTGGGNQHSNWPSITADGRYVAFDSVASNLVTQPDSGTNTDVFVHDRLSAQTKLITIAWNGVQGSGSIPTISEDGARVAFRSSYPLVEADTNKLFDVFVQDVESGINERVSVDSAGIAADAASNYGWISADARFVSFLSLASNLAPGVQHSSIATLYVHELSDPPPELDWTLSFSPRLLDFGRRTISTSSGKRTITVTNISAAPVAIRRVDLWGAPGQFLFTNNCGVSLPAGDSCTVQVQFRPLSQGLKYNFLTVNSRRDGGLRAVRLQGTGIE